MVATFDGDELSEPLHTVNTDETAPQGLVLHPGKKHLICIFAGKGWHFSVFTTTLFFAVLKHGTTDMTASMVHVTQADTPRKWRATLLSGDVAVYDVEGNGNALAENEESDAPSPAEASPVTLTPRDKDADGAAKRVTLAEVDIKCGTFDPSGKTLAIGLETGEVQLCSWPELKAGLALFTLFGSHNTN
jgi:hypothetical protein